MTIGMLSGAFSVFATWYFVVAYATKTTRSRAMTAATFGFVHTSANWMLATNRTIETRKKTLGSVRKLIAWSKRFTRVPYSGPEMPPSFLTLQKWTAMSTIAMTGTAMQWST